MESRAMLAGLHPDGMLGLKPEPGEDGPLDFRVVHADERAEALLQEGVQGRLVRPGSSPWASALCTLLRTACERRPPAPVEGSLPRRQGSPLRVRAVPWEDGAACYLDEASPAPGSSPGWAPPATAGTPTMNRCGCAPVESAGLAPEAAASGRESFLHEALAAASTAVWAWDSRCRHLELTATLPALFGKEGQPPPVLSTLEPLLALVHAEDRPRVERTLASALVSASHYTVQYRVPFDDGVHWHEVRGRAVKERGGGVRLVGLVSDVTARKREEDAQAREARLRERFIGILSHDLRNPLHAVRLAVQGLRTSVGGTEAALGRIESSTERMERMVEQLLDFTRVRLAGGIPMRPAWVDLHALCRKVVAEHELTHPGRAVQLQALGDGAGEWDGERLEQVVQNLVGNALDHSPPELPVEVTLRDAGGAQELEVRNGGPTIPGDILEHLFEPFRSGAEASTLCRRQLGLGLGLYIVREIVRAHRGDVTVHSDPDAGTTFVVRLPRHRESAGAPVRVEPLVESSFVA